jgi:transposase InsO family protein
VTKHQCFPEPLRVAKRARKRKRTGALGRRKRIQELAIREEPHFLVQVDTVVRYLAGTKRYIFTAIDHVTKLAYARMYTSGSSQSAADFLQRLWILFGARIQNLQTDNGSEFAGAFADACRDLGVTRYFSRVKTPKDNAVEERFNETLDLEFLRDGNLDSDVQRFNAKLAPWLVEYNTVRPHATLSYLTPLEFLERHRRGRMWSSTTHACARSEALLHRRSTGRPYPGEHNPRLEVFGTSRMALRNATNVPRIPSRFMVRTRSPVRLRSGAPYRLWKRRNPLLRQMPHPRG